MQRLLKMRTFFERLKSLALAYHPLISGAVFMLVVMRAGDERFASFFITQSHILVFFAFFGLSLRQFADSGRDVPIAKARLAGNLLFCATVGIMILMTGSDSLAWAFVFKKLSDLNFEFFSIERETTNFPRALRTVENSFSLILLEWVCLATTILSGKFEPLLYGFMISGTASTWFVYKNTLGRPATRAGLWSADTIGIVSLGGVYAVSALLNRLFISHAGTVEEINTYGKVFYGYFLFPPILTVFRKKMPTIPLLRLVSGVVVGGIAGILVLILLFPIYKLLGITVAYSSTSMTAALMLLVAGAAGLMLDTQSLGTGRDTAAVLYLLTSTVVMLVSVVIVQTVLPETSVLNTLTIAAAAVLITKTIWLINVSRK